jgi:hypothetical protein
MLYPIDQILFALAGTNSTNIPAPTPAESLTSLVTAISLLVGAVAPLIISSLSYIKAKSHDPKIDKALDTAISVGKLSTAVSNKALENKESIKAAIELGLAVTPEEAQKTIAQKQALLEKLNAEIAATSAQLKRLQPLIPGEANADTIADLPREKT